MAHARRKAAQHKLIRRQYLLEPRQVEKLDRLASREHKSAAAIVRLAIDAYDPDTVGDLGAEELMELVSARLKEATRATRAATRKVERTLKALDTQP